MKQEEIRMAKEANDALKFLTMNDGVFSCELYNPITQRCACDAEVKKKCNIVRSFNKIKSYLSLKTPKGPKVVNGKVVCPNCGKEIDRLDAICENCFQVIDLFPY